MPARALVGCALGALAASAGFAAALAPHVPPMAAVERGEYRARDARTGEGLWRHAWTAERTTQDGRTLIRVAQNGRGRREGPAPTVWTSAMHVWLSAEHVRLISRREIRDHLGALVEVEERTLDSAAGTGQITLVDAASGRTSLRSIAVSRMTTDAEMLPMELRLLIARGEHRMRFELVAEEGTLVGMEAKIVGRERVDVPAGVFDCYRIDLRATGALGAVARLVLPGISMWHTVAAPHFWVKYRGPAGGVGSREIVRELTRYEQRGE